MFGNIFSSKSSSSSTANFDQSDHSVNLNAEGQGMSLAAGAIGARDGGIAAAGDVTLVQNLGADVFNRAADTADVANMLMSDVARTATATAGQTAADTLTAAAAMVDNNARLAGQSMDTALAFAANARPASATFTDAIPIVAIAAAIALIGYALIRKKR